MSIHTSTRPNLTSRLSTAATATCSEKEGGQRIEKEKKMCIVCEKQLALSSFSRHMKDKHGEDQKCNVCGKKFQTINTLENHQKKTHVVKHISYYECEFCDYKSMNKYYISDHVKRQHRGEGTNSFVCSQCYARKQNEHLLKKHMQQHQESNCVVCGKKFNSTKNLKRHGKVHEIQRCQDCGKIFNAKRDLKLHKKEHKNKKTTQEYEVRDPIDNLEDVEFIMENMEELRELDDEALALLKMTLLKC